MTRPHDLAYSPLLMGQDATEGLVAVEHVEGRAQDRAALYFRDGAGTRREEEPLAAFLVADAAVLEGCPGACRVTPLAGGRRLNARADFATWKALEKARKWLAAATGRSASAQDAPYYVPNDPVQQHLMATGRTLFLGMAFEDLRRMQVDIECLTSEGYEFCNADREGDAIVAVALGLPDGTVEVLAGPELDEKALLERFVAHVREADPDVLEGHNIFNFDLPYLAARAKRHGVALALGRDGSEPARRASRMSVGERQLSYERFDVAGRHVVDTYQLVQIYDVTHRSLESFGLKEVARHFGVAAPGRTYIEGGAIGRAYREDTQRFLAYAGDDAIETRAVADLLSRSSFVQARLLPFSYQNVCVRGNATKIDALLVREYLRRGESLPLPDAPRAFAGGYTDVFETGVIGNVHHCDVRSLYPSLMLSRGLAPRSDGLGVFLKLLGALRTYRLDARRAMLASRGDRERLHYDALQATFKILINSFYGYLGFAQARFGDFGAAEQVTAGGRELLRGMLEWLRARGARPIELDTDGIYFVPPPGLKGRALEQFRGEFAASLPEGIEVEFDGEYRSMYSYRMKNYALLSDDGTVSIKGAALKSRGLERFQRRFVAEALRLWLEGRQAELPALKARYEAAIRGREWPIAMLAKTETLQDSPATYEAKRAKGKSPRRAVYELALASGREYRAGDQVSYYITGESKRVSVHASARLVSAWNPDARDENVAYYLAKLDALYAKFMEGGEGADEGEGEDE